MSFTGMATIKKILGCQKVTTEKVEVGALPLDHSSSIMASLSVNVNVLVFRLKLTSGPLAPGGPLAPCGPYDVDNKWI